MTVALGQLQRIMSRLSYDLTSAKSSYIAFKVDSFNKFTVYMDFKKGDNVADHKTDALTAAQAEFGKGATRIVDSGVKVSKLPDDAWQSNRVSWAWFKRGW